MNEYKKKYKTYDPITSWGIILINFDKNFKYNHPDDKIKIDSYKEIKLENKKIIQITNDVMNNMKYLLEVGEQIGIYQPVNYSENPKQYCGMEINSTPYKNFN